MSSLSSLRQSLVQAQEKARDLSQENSILRESYSPLHSIWKKSARISPFKTRSGCRLRSWRPRLGMDKEKKDAFLKSGHRHRGRFAVQYDII
jgi:methylphosphotriester-DNA--protein-cysteine methyltransferase